MPGRGFPGAVLSRPLGIRARLSAAHTHTCVRGRVMQALACKREQLLSIPVDYVGLGKPASGKGRSERHPDEVPVHRRLLWLWGQATGLVVRSKSLLAAGKVPGMFSCSLSFGRRCCRLSPSTGVGTQRIQSLQIRRGCNPEGEAGLRSQMLSPLQPFGNPQARGVGSPAALERLSKLQT